MNTMGQPAFQRGMDFKKANDRRALARRVKEHMEHVKAMLAERKTKREASRAQGD